MHAPDDPKHADMGIHWTFNGTAKGLLTGGNTALAIHIAKRYECKFTRIDLAIDQTGLLDAVIHPRDFEKALRDEMGAGTTRKRNLGHYMRDEGGYTLSAGSPQSDVYGIVYDKANEQGIADMNWTRYEFRIRRRVADAVRAELASSNSPLETIKSLIAGFMLSFYGKTLSDAVLGDVWGFLPQFISQAHKSIDPDWWLFSTAAKAVANRLNTFDSEHDASAWMKEFIRQVWQMTKHQ